MKTTIDIVDRLIPIINVASVTSLINGGVYAFQRPLNSELEDIIINSLPISSDDVIQNGIANINCFCQNFSNKTPNVDKLNSFAKAVLSVLESFAAINEYFSFDVVWNTILAESESECYANIRIRYYIQKEEN